MMSNYAAVFIDLLGQKAALLREGDLLPGNQEKAVELARSSVGAVRWLHDRFQTFYDGLTEDPTGGSSSLDHARAKEIRAVSLKYQRFSDGLVMYLSLYGHPPKPEAING